jgi:hypothetical protein
LHAPRISADRSETQAIAGATLVVDTIPKARDQVRNAPRIGPAWSGIPVLGQNSANLKANLEAIQMGLCQIEAAKVQVAESDVCGYGTYMTRTGRVLASGEILDQAASRDLLLEGLADAERNAKNALQLFCPPLMASIEKDTRSSPEQKRLSLQEFHASCARG